MASKRRAPSKARTGRTARTPVTASAATGDVPVVGPREDCPCGSGRRYKACHGRAAAQTVTELVRRPFEGLAGEADWVALRELVPAATAALTLRDGLPEGVPAVRLATVLPLAAPAMRREDGEVLVALQNDVASGDLSRALGTVLRRALDAEPGTYLEPVSDAADGPRLQDLLDPSAAPAPEVHDDFAFWAEGTDTPSPEVAASRERAETATLPTARLRGVEAAYWCGTPERNHLRWVMTHPEERLLDALATLHAAGDSSLGEGTRLVGSFRAHGLTVPVWDLPREMSAEECEKPAAAFAERLGAALAALEGGAALTPEQRRARSGLTNRQVTLS